MIAHAVHEELVKHKKDAIEWGVIGGERSDAIDEHATFASTTVAGVAGGRDRGGHGLMKDKTGLGLGLGRAPRDGRGPKTLRSVWRDWAEADEFRTVFEELTAEDIEKREIERERSTRYLKFLLSLTLMCSNRFWQATEKRNVEIPEFDSDETEMTFIILYFILPLYSCLIAVLISLKSTV